MPTIIIDDHELEIAEGERLNGIQAAARVGIEIPHYCWHPGLSVVGSCRMCLVEYGTPRSRRRARSTMLPKLVPACQTPALDGTVFVTNSEKVARARAMVEEDLLLRHPIDCPICDKAGECDLQDYHFQLRPERAPGRRPPVHQPAARRRAEVTLFVDRCVLCSRCVRFTREISGTAELMVIGRGAHEEIDVVPGFPLDNKLSGNVVDLCPVGALGDKDFLYRQRVWFLRRHAGVCTRLRDGLLDLDRREPGPHLPAQAAREPARQPVVDLQRRPLRLSARPRSPAADRARATRRQRRAWRSIGRTCPASWTGGFARRDGWRRWCRRF